MSQPVFVVDAFTDAPFAGNPAAVCPLAGPADEQWMRHVAAEMNLSETAFIHPAGDGWRIRWLTPTVEVELCGHATLASAHVLWETGRVPADAPISFTSLGGPLSAARRGESIELDFPARLVVECTPPPGLTEALGMVPRFVGANGLDLFADLDDETAVRQLRPDFVRLRKLSARGVIVTARPDDGRDCDFVSRFFAPGSGIDEDPVTGSAHCALGPFWAARLGRNDLVGRQVSARGGVVRVGVRGDRVLLGGRAVTVLRGELLPVPAGS